MNLKVLDIDELIKARMEEEKKKVVEAAREEAVENAIVVIKAKIKEELEKAKGKAQNIILFIRYDASKSLPFL